MRSVRGLIGFLMLLLAVAYVQPGSINRVKRHDEPESTTTMSTSESPNNESSTKPHALVACADKEPCGWVSYEPFTRIVTNTMRNPCECPGKQQCVKDGDDVRASAYVYRCAHVKNSGDTNSS